MAAPPRIRRRRGSRAKHPRVYLGPAYAYPDSAFQSQKRARLVFLDIVARRYPDILVQLEQDALEPYRRLVQSNPVGISLEDSYEITADENYDLAPAAVALRHSLRVWADRWSLPRPWVRDHALATLEVFAEGLLIDAWMSPNEGAKFLKREPLTFDGWDPAYERWSEWVRGFRRDLPARLDAYRASQEGRARAAGMVPNDESKLMSHFIWLARFQVGREDVIPIATSDWQERTTVRDAVHGVAELLDLPLREPRKGRPPKR